jgi:hypothetical protein
MHAMHQSHSVVAHSCGFEGEDEGAGGGPSSKLSLCQLSSESMTTAKEASGNWRTPECIVHLLLEFNQQDKVSPPPNRCSPSIAGERSPHLNLRTASGPLQVLKER